MKARRIAVVMLALQWATTAVAGEVPFAAQPAISAAANAPAAAVLADLDRDGDLDVLVASSGDDRVAWFENTDGAGSFAAAQVVTAAAAGARSLVVADLDRDGDPDVVVASEDDDRIAWYENDGTPAGAGDWTQHVVSNTVDGARSVHASDLDGDGDLDLLSAGRVDQQLAWHENTDGAGSFAAEQVVDGTLVWPESVTAADLDGDGDRDLLVADFQADLVAWYPNSDGAGTFGAKQLVATGIGGPAWIEAADIDGDGDLDVLASLQNADSIAWYENDGSGSGWSAHVTAAGGDAPEALSVSDLDADGDRDLLVATSGDGAFGWHENTDGQGSFGPRLALATGVSQARQAVVGDLDRDGDSDVLGIAAGGAVAWYRNETIARSTVFPAEVLVLQCGGKVLSAAVGDLDGDGDPDVVSGGEQGFQTPTQPTGIGVLAWYQNPLPASFWVSRNISSASLDAESVVIADIDGDGALDLLAASAQSDEVAWYANDLGTGTSWTRRVVTATADGAKSVIAGDLDRDGDLDVLAASEFDNTLAWFENTNGDGTAFSEHAIDTATVSPVAVAHADLDGDGTADVLSVAAGDATLRWYPNDGTPATGGWTPIAIGTGADRNVVAADLDRDGDLDVVTASGQNGEVLWFENDGTPLTGPWTTHSIDAGASGVAAVAVGDADADGRPDVFVALDPPGTSNDRFVVYRNLDGNGTSWESVVVQSGARAPRQVLAADLDLDGLVDVVGAATDTNRVTWHRNRGGQFGLLGTDVSSPVAFESGTAALLRVDIAHRGRAQDSDVELTSLAIRLENATSGTTSMQTADANALFDSLAIHLDDGSGSFEAGVDPVVASLSVFNLLGGVQAVPFADGEPSVQVSPGTTRTLFVVVSAAPDAGSHPVDRFKATLRSESESSGEDASEDLPARLEFNANVATQAIELVDPDADGDADGLSYAEESVLGTDPHAADSDGDGWTDGTEAALGSDPNDENDSPTVPAGAPFVAGTAVDTASTGAAAIVAADVDGNGSLDAIVASPAGNRVDWYANLNGDGSVWNAAAVSTVDSGALDAIAVDLDGDGDEDVVSAAPGDGTVTWYENGDGTGFAWIPHGISTSSVGAAAVSAADVDRDGDFDVFAAAPGAAQPLAWHENTAGDGTAWSARPIATGVPPGPSVFAADLDRDGDLDAVSVGGTVPGKERVVWHANTDGAGSFGVSQDIAALLPGARAVSAADIDGDGDPDVAVASQSPGNRVSWHENAAGDASVWVPHVVSVRPRPVLRVDAVDLDRDGDTDLVVASAEAIEWFENLSGDGTFWAPRVLTQSGPLLLGAAVGAADVDGDGDLDVLGGDALRAEIPWFENRTLHRSALFPESLDVAVLIGVGARSVAGADIDGDGDLDALTTIDPDRVVWLANTSGDGTAWTLADIDVAFAGGGDEIVAADVDGDGDFDAIAVSALDDHVAWFENTVGDGSTWTTHTVSSALDAPHGIRSRDVDRDGDVDLLVASGGDGQLTWFENLASDGSSWAAVPIASATAGSVGRPAVGDLDGDGDPDVLWTVETTSVVWLDNVGGDGSSWSQRAVATTAGPVRAAAVADIDADGDLDVIVGTSGVDDQVAWHENATGDGLTWVAHAIGGADDFEDVWVADLDADGDLDVAAASSGDDAVRWFENQSGDGLTWTGHVVTTSRDQSRRLFADDVDGDGAPDLMTVSAGDGRVAWIPNRGGQFAVTSVSLGRSLLEGEAEAVLRFEAIHRGRGGDGDAELSRIRLRFEDAFGSAYSSAQANALFASVAVYRDDGSGVYEPGLDALMVATSPLTLSAGVLDLDPPDGSATAALSAGAPVTFFVVVAIAPGAGSESPHLFQVSHATGASSEAEDAAFDAPLDPEWSPAVGTGVIGALDAGLDDDGDGLSNGDELSLHGTDPLDADSDGDGFTDGQEVAAGTDPNDAQSFPPFEVPAASALWFVLLMVLLLVVSQRALRSLSRFRG